MAYNESLVSRVREALAELTDVEEKKMFRGITFMVNGKMCVSVGGDEMMCRIDPAIHEKAMEKEGCREMIHGGKTMKGFVFVQNEALKSKRNFDWWIQHCLEYNTIAKAARPRTKRKK